MKRRLKTRDDLEDYIEERDKKEVGFRNLVDAAVELRLAQLDSDGCADDCYCYDSMFGTLKDM